MNIPKSVSNLAKVFQQNGHSLFLVGGAVRDELLGVGSHDYDFATDATPNEVTAMFRNVIPVGIQHGTVVVLFEGEQYEVTTFRTEGDYSDNRHPDEVHFVRNIDEDLSRRDFTINALAWDLQNKCLKDNFDGKGDLKRKVIRAIGNPDERFNEDALRMLRACRFAAKLEFTIDEETLASMTRLSHLIQNISEERIRDEFIKMMGSPRPSVGIEYMRVSGLLDFILPELMKGYGVVQNRFHKFDVYYHNVYSCDAAPADNYIVRIAALFHDIAKPQAKRAKADELENENENSFYNHDIVGERVAKHILRRLKFTNEDTKKIRHLIKNHMFYYTDDWTDGAVRRFLRKVGVENLPDLFALREADRLGNGTKAGIPKAFIDFQDRIKHILEVDAALKVSDLDINGNDIMTELQLAPGPIIGEILNFLLELVLDNPEINTHETLMERAKEYYNKKKDYCMEQYGKPPEQLGRF